VPDCPGHPDLIAAIAKEIRKFGPVPFARFMELALYHPQFGYYMRLGEKEDAEGPRGTLVGEDRIGWSGDYYTSSDVHPILAGSLAKQIAQMDELLGRPSPLVVIEMGAGKGQLARDLLAAYHKLSGSLFERLHYVIIERSPAMQESQRRHLTPWLSRPGRVSWLSSVTELGTESVVGVLFSNELVDAFPVHRLRVQDGQPQEVFVGYDDRRFSEELRPLSADLEEYLRRLSTMGVTLPEGARAEINLQAVAWMKEVSAALRRGFVITIDYGHIVQDLYGPDRHGGTLLCYYHHLASEDPYRRVGLQDMTAHVDFSTLAAVGEETGLHVTGFTNQMSFLIGLGVEALIEDLEPGTPEFQSVIHLLRPEGMGRTFKLLIQHKGLAAPVLEGLRFKPFFGSALTQTAFNV
jgi:SAM-dependent MidA family methyltransferase